MNSAQESSVTVVPVPLRFSFVALFHFKLFFFLLFLLVVVERVYFFADEVWRKEARTFA